MNPASQDIAGILDGEISLGLTLNTDLFWSRMPDSPIDVVTIFDNAGGAPMLTYDKATSNYFESSVSVQVRNLDYGLGWAQIKSILDFLHAESGIVEDVTLYTLIRAMNDPQLLHWDKNDRAVLFVNFEVQRRLN